MKITALDIRKRFPNLASVLPKQVFSVPSNHFLCFGYNVLPDNKLFIESSSIATTPTLSFKFVKEYLKYDFLASFKEPFDTKSLLFYRFLLHYIYSPNNQFALDDLKKLYAEATSKDLNEQSNIDSFAFDGSFPIVDRSSMQSALFGYYKYLPKAVDDILSMTDQIDSFLMATEKKSLYGGLIKKIVKSTPNPNGGLIPEYTGAIRYMYVGETAKLDADKQLMEAKRMIRMGVNQDFVYYKTGWFLSKFDGKWRFRITDTGASLTDEVEKFIASGKPIGFFCNYALSEKILSESENKESISISKEVLSQSVVTLPKILKHDTLFKLYPELKTFKVFFGINQSGFKPDHSCYFTSGDSEPYIVIFSNPQKINLLNVLIHELQHYVQHREGFATGGNSQMARMVFRLGGKNYRDFINTVRGACTLVEDKPNSYYANVIAFSNALDTVSDSHKLFKNAMITFLDGINEIDFIQRKGLLANTIICSLADYEGYSSGISSCVASTLGEDLDKAILKLRKLLDEGVSIAAEASIYGYSDREMRAIYFKLYECILGELEARDSQNFPNESELMIANVNYFKPYSTESFDENKIIVVDYNRQIGGVYSSGCENISDGGYVLHFSETTKTKQVWHELGHIIFDFYKGDVRVEENFINQFVQYVGQNTNSELIKKELNATIDASKLTFDAFQKKDYDEFFTKIFKG